MYEKSAMLLLSLLVGLAAPVRADILTLKDGRHVSGQCTRDGDMIIIVTDDGETSKYSKDEYKSCIHESIVSDSGLRRMFDDLAALITPVLDKTEPSPKQFLEKWNSYAQKLGNIRIARGQRIRRQGVPQPPDTASFLYDWTRYTGKFKAIHDSAKYKKLTRKGRKGSGSLKEYVMNPRVERADIAEAVGAAIKAFEDCLELAELTDRLVKALPRIQERHDEKIRKAFDQYIAAEDAVRTAGNRIEAQQRANSALRDYQAPVRKMETEMRRSVNGSQAKINDFAQARELAKLNAVGARELIEGLIATDGNGVDGALLESRQFAERHRLAAQSKRVTGVKLEVLRERTLTQIKRLFVGHTFALTLTVREHRDSGPDGYRLKADYGLAESRQRPLSVDLHVLQDAKDAVIKCETGDEVNLKARIAQVSVTPPLPVLEISGDEATVVLTGDVLAVTSGCKR